VCDTLFSYRYCNILSSTLYSRNKKLNFMWPYDGSHFNAGGTTCIGCAVTPTLESQLEWIQLHPGGVGGRGGIPRDGDSGSQRKRDL